jgi:serine/threonine-protein kinase
MSLREGSVLGNYQIIGKLGEGGMGAVYKAVDSMLHRDVAIKALRPEISAQPDVLERFRSEAVLLAKLNHPSIAQLYSFFNEGGNFYMVMEFVAGETIERVIQQQGAMDWRRALKLTMQILDGLGEAHAANILHRDLKPANVMLTPAGKIKLMDFGIAQALGAARMTRQGRIIGTLEYLAPERIQGKPADTRSDLYSVGVMLFEMLSGKLPFQSDSEYELLQMQIQQAPPQLAVTGAQVPAEVEAAMGKALEKDPERRYASTEEFSGALGALLGTPTAAIAPAVAAAVPAVAVAAAAPAVPAPWKTWMAKPVFWLASAGVLVLAAGSIVMSTLHSRQPAPATVADMGQPGIYQPQQSALKIDSTPIVLTPQPAPTSQAPSPQAPPTPARATPRQPAQSQTQSPSPAPAAPPSTPAATPPPEPTPAAPPPMTVAERTPANVPPPPVAATPPQSTPSATRVVRLSDAHSVYVAGGQGELDGFIREEIQRQIGPRLRIAGSMTDADIIMRVTLDEPKGKGFASAGRIFGVKDRAEVRAVVIDAHTSHVMWQQGAGDRKPIVGAFHGESLKRVAERIIKEFRDSYSR